LSWGHFEPAQHVSTVVDFELQRREVSAGSIARIKKAWRPVASNQPILNKVPIAKGFVWLFARGRESDEASRRAAKLHARESRRPVIAHHDRRAWTGHPRYFPPLDGEGSED
jgi:hypothetical protein